MKISTNYRALERVPSSRTPSLLLAITVAILVVTSSAIAAYVRTLGPDPFQAFARGCLVRTGSTIVTLDKVTRPHYVGTSITRFTIGCRSAGGTITGHIETNHI